jgi:hypothetical protein
MITFNGTGGVGTALMGFELVYRELFWFRYWSSIVILDTDHKNVS